MFFFHVLKLLKVAEEGSELVLSEQSMRGSFSRISLKKGKSQKDSSEFFPVFQGILQRMRKERHVLCFSLRIEDLASGRDVVLFRDVREIPENFSLWVENISSGGKIPTCRIYLEVGYLPAEKLISKAPKEWQLAYQWALEVSGKIAALVSSPEGYGIWDGENLSQVLQGNRKGMHFLHALFYPSRKGGLYFVLFFYSFCISNGLRTLFVTLSTVKEGFILEKLYFHYGAMSSGKTAQLIGVATNYEVQGKRVLIFSSSLDSRAEENTVSSRNGFTFPSLGFDRETDLYSEIFSSMSADLHCVLVDEAHFLSGDQVMQLSFVVDRLGVPVICFGLKNDFRNRLFAGAEYLLLYADVLKEIKTVCWFCNRKATMNLRLAEGRPVYEGEQVLIGGTESYLPVCRRCYSNPPLARPP